jgi:hypothetical protein
LLLPFLVVFFVLLVVFVFVGYVEVEPVFFQPLLQVVSALLGIGVELDAVLPQDEYVGVGFGAVKTEYLYFSVARFKYK